MVNRAEAERGETKLMISSFPSSFCSDGWPSWTRIESMCLASEPAFQVLLERVRSVEMVGTSPACSFASAVHEHVAPGRTARALNAGDQFKPSGQTAASVIVAGMSENIAQGPSSQGAEGLDR